MNIEKGANLYPGLAYHSLLSYAPGDFTAFHLHEQCNGFILVLREGYERVGGRAGRSENLN